MARARAGGFTEGQTALAILLAAAHLDDAGQGAGGVDVRQLSGAPSSIQRSMIRRSRSPSRPAFDGSGGWVSR